MMETIRVNMTPCEDVKTIHASQNDNEAREWGFELHNNGEKIDSSSISDQMVFKAYKGGTEQILPENGSTPTTSPFKGDIKYPQGLLTDQEFLYRQSPAEEDGNAKIKSLYGNTLVWNQHSDTITPGTASKGLTMSRKTGVDIPTIHIEGTYNYESGQDINFYVGWAVSRPKFAVGHKILVLTTMKSFGIGTYTATPLTYGGERAILVTITQDNYLNLLFRCKLPNGSAINEDFTVNVFDLTQMGLDITDPSDFTSLFPLSYYSYNQGSLLSFNGNGIKTTGKNLIEGRGTGNIYNGGNLIPVRQGDEFWIYADYTTIGTTNMWCGIFSSQGETNKGAYIADMGYFASGSVKKLTASKDGYIGFCYGSGVSDYTVNKTMLSFASFTPSEYEAYTSSTLSLPISTIFPNGMDGVGDAYDELSNSGYAKRMGRIDLGSITYTRTESQVSGVYFFVGAYNSIPNIKNRPNSVVWNIKTPLYEVVNSTRIYQGFAQNKTIGGYDAQTVRIRDDSFTDATSFKNSLSGQYLVYELATPLENYGVVDLGTLDWIYNDSFKRFHSTGLSNLAKFPSSDTTVANILSNEFATVSAVYFNNNKTVDKLVALSMYGSIYARNLSMTDVNEFKSSLSGVYLLYEKENHQGFTTATLVTENGETPLSNEDGVLIGKCTEQLSENPGFFDAKIKLANEDGECYSNKIQLHVERSPQ